MFRLQNQTKAVILLLFVLLTVPFYESKKVETLAISSESQVFRSLSLFYAQGSEKLKMSLGLASFFQQESDFWKNIKKSPQVFEKSSGSALLTNPLPSQTPTAVPGPPYNILIVGDSFIAERFGAQLEKEMLLYKDVKVYRKGVYSTGLSRPDYFDWNKELKELISRYNPNIAIVMFGANDAQDQVLLEGDVIHYSSPEWNIEYSKRVSEFIDILTKNKISVFWLGMPISKHDYYNKKMENLNSIYQTECRKYGNAVFIPTWGYLFNAEGKYADYLLDENGNQKLARTQDGIHVTVFGADVMLKKVMAELKEKIKIELISL